jgi:hypothetical protein
MGIQIKQRSKGGYIAYGVFLWTVQVIRVMIDLEGSVLWIVEVGNKVNTTIEGGHFRLQFALRDHKYLVTSRTVGRTNEECGGYSLSHHCSFK